MNLAHYFPYAVKLGLLAHGKRFLANQKARNAIAGAENLLHLYNREEFSASIFFSFSEIIKRLVRLENDNENCLSYAKIFYFLAA